MTDTSRHQIIILGCGRVGVELARSLSEKKHTVTVVDSNARSFDRLGPDFTGRTVQGQAIDQDVLMRAGIETADAFAAATSSDSINIVAARVARDIFHVEHVVARIYNPRRAAIYERLGLQTVASSSWGAQRIEQLILHSELENVGAAGNGEVQFYEIDVPDEWAGRSMAELVPAEHAIPIALTRGGKTCLPNSVFTLQAHDLLQVSATAEGASVLRKRLKINGEK